MTIREALTRGTAKLKNADIESPGLDTALLLAFTLDTVKEQLFLRDREPLSESAAASFAALLDRRIAGECTAWLLGRKEFYGLEFKVTPDVLVPRPDTETLVEAALTVLGKIPHDPIKASAACSDTATVPDKPHPGDSPVKTSTTGSDTAAVPDKPHPGDGPMKESAGIVNSTAVLDLCTGSGAVAISLKHECPALRVYASDISPQALTIARENAGRLLAGLSPDNSIHFLEGDIFAPLTPDTPRFRLITANPPYVPFADIAGLAPEVRKEPLLALDGGEDGLDLIRRIIEDAAAYLLPGGALLMEADPRQMAAIALILEKKGYRNIRTFQDLSSRDRVIGAIGPG